jgi:hypothetical protein
MSQALRLKPLQDSLAFVYGELADGRRVASATRTPGSWCPTPYRHMDATHWLVFIDGEQVARWRTRQEAERAAAVAP